MYAERIPLTNAGAIHNGTLGYLQQFIGRGHQLTIDGNPATIQSLYGQFSDPVYSNPDTEVEIAAHTGNPQQDRDLVHIAKRTLWAGKNIWPRQPTLEDQHLNKAANYLRATEGLPQEGHDQLPPEMVAQVPPYQQREAGAYHDPSEGPHGGYANTGDVVCSGCGKRVIGDTCKHCGRHTDGSEEDVKAGIAEHAAARDPEEPTTPPVERTKKCHHCGAEVGYHEDTCPDCSGSLEQDHESSYTERTPTTVDTLKSKAAKWHVVGLGEMQQPSAVQQPGDGSVNPVAEGANPDFDMGRMDQASRTQEVAVEGWVNFAIGELTKGMDPEGVKAQLAAAGAPAHEVPTIMDLATQALAQQNQQQTPEAADANAPQFPTAPDPAQQQTVTGPQQPQLAAYRIAGTGIKGRIKSRYTDTWGRDLVRFATEDGNLIEVDPKRVEMVTEEAHDPVAEVESYINALPEVTRNADVSVAASNIKRARLAIQNLVTAGNLSEAQVYRLDELDSICQQKLVGVRQAYIDNPWDADYLAAQPKFSMQAAEQGSIGAGAKHGGLDFEDVDPAEQLDAEREIREGAPIMVQELHPLARTDRESVREAAHAHIWPRTSGLPREEREEITERFIASALRHVGARPAQQEPVTFNNDGPAEALFI